ncbi:MAG: hypothetical protein AAB558_03370 [Patescibacteria group bacterium]
METTHILGHIVDYEDQFKLVIKALRKMEDQDSPELREWFETAGRKGNPKITDVDGLGNKRFTIKIDGNTSRYSIDEYKSKGGWF